MVLAMLSVFAIQSDFVMLSGNFIRHLTRIELLQFFLLHHMAAILNLQSMSLKLRGEFGPFTEGFIVFQAFANDNQSTIYGH